jgi:hypothetical protein
VFHLREWGRRTSSFCAASQAFLAAASAFLKASSSGRSGLWTIFFADSKAGDIVVAAIVDYVVFWLALLHFRSQLLAGGMRETRELGGILPDSLEPERDGGHSGRWTSEEARAVGRWLLLAGWELGKVALLSAEKKLGYFTLGFPLQWRRPRTERPGMARSAQSQGIAWRALRLLLA